MDRARPWRFNFDGVAYTGLAGDTLASALLANGVHEVARSIALGRPRGIFAAGADEPNALVQLEGDWPEPMLPATRVELVNGLSAHRLHGRGRLRLAPHAPAFDRLHAHCD
ncbi:MAG: 2Fe-2S iron-sulfur cluster-binding protein, partial [Candidatus Dormibacteraeota bacterium]|nr:2Fe-2S iron-sulfur cluster-binding protein [Candidatus Dormibacteraeota bacterium]